MKIDPRFIADFIAYTGRVFFNPGYPADQALKADLQGVLRLPVEVLIQRPMTQMPWLVYRVAGICGGAPERTFPLCLAVFLFSRLITIVDDMQDNDEMRCGERAYWVLHGISNTELASLTLLSLSYLYVNSMREHLSESAVSGCVELFSDMFLKTTEGQRRDIALSKNLECSMDEYLGMVELKGGVIHACLVALGVLCARGDVEMARAVYGGGIPLGMALQFHNDMRDLQPFREKLGRERNSDFFEARISLPFIYGRNTLPPGKRDRLVELYGKKEKSLADQQEVDDLLGGSGVTLYAEMLADSYLEKAVGKYRDAGLSGGEIDQILDLLCLRR